MASRGQTETDQLKDNLQNQLCRLVSQLKDLEEIRPDIDEKEYLDVKFETVAQMKEFSKTLSKFVSGNVTLVDDLNAMQLAIQAAISAAFTIPEVICMFGKKQHRELRVCLTELDVSLSHGKVSEMDYKLRKAEILMALQQLNEPLSEAEYRFLEHHATVRMKEFETICENTGSLEKVISLAENDISSSGSSSSK